MRFTEKLAARIAQTNSLLCVGLDPRAENIEGSLEDFIKAVIEETAEYAAAFKPNIAYFEAYGAAGYKVLEDSLKLIPKEIPIVLDVKRTDIPETQKYYAKSYFENWDVDSVTLSPFMGFDSIEPYLQYEGKGVYLLGITSNPGAHEFMTGKLEDETVLEKIQAFADRAEGMPADVGLVAGLTNVTHDVLASIKDIPLLIPGLGAQGGDISVLDIQSRKAPILINSSRSILYGNEGSYADRAKKAVEKINQALSVKA